MRSRPAPVTVAIILLVLLGLIDSPLLWKTVFPALFPGVERPPDSMVLGIVVVGIVGLAVAIGL
jgi:hypothetical protein